MKDFVDLPSFNPVEHLLSVDADEGNVLNVIPFPNAEEIEEDENNEVTYFKLKGASKFGNDILVDSFGYIYSLNNQKYNNDASLLKQTWKCNKRTNYKNNKIICNCHIKLVPDPCNSELFKYVKIHDHNHEPVSNVCEMRQLRYDLKQQCLSDPLCYPRTLIQEYFIDHVDYNKCVGQTNFPTVQTLVKLIRRERLKYAPPLVCDIFFDIEEHHLPLSFLKAVITVENDASHL